MGGGIAQSNPQVNMLKLLMYLMQYIHKVTVLITERLSRQRRIQNTVKQLRWSVLQKNKGAGNVAELGSFDKALHDQGFSFQNQETSGFQKGQGRSPLS